MTKLTKLYLQIKTHLSALLSDLFGHADSQTTNNRIETVAETPTEPATE